MEIPQTIYQNFLNKRNSIRELQDQEFENIVEQLASELSDIDYHITYDDVSLLNDWKKLKVWSTEKNPSGSAFIQNQLLATSVM